LPRRADFSAQLPSTTLQLIGEGKLVALAVSAGKRAASDAAGADDARSRPPRGFDLSVLRRLVHAREAPRAIVEKLHQGGHQGDAGPLVQERFKQLGVEPMPMTIAQFETFFRDDVEAAVALVKAADIPKQ
jgi:tripartite-type tricarboxylate transporter receptor subunit TctC